VFGLANLNIYHWLVIVALSLLPLIVTEVWKLCKNIKKN
jgi:hypothetical protein